MKFHRIAAGLWLLAALVAPQFAFAQAAYWNAIGLINTSNVKWNGWNVGSTKWYRAGCVRTFYVNFDTGNDSNTQTQAQSPATPWRTLTEASNSTPHLSGGDCVSVHATATVDKEAWAINISGTSDTVGGYLAYYCDGAALRSCQIQVPDAGTADVGVLQMGTGVANFVIVDGFSINGNDSLVGQVEGYECIQMRNIHHIYIYNTEMYNCGAGGANISGGDLIVYEGNVVHHNAHFSHQNTSGLNMVRPLVQSAYPTGFDPAVSGANNKGFRNIYRNNVLYGNAEYSAAFTGSTAGLSTTLTAGTPGYGTILVGQTLFAATGVSGSPTILSQISGTPGGAGTYQLSSAQNLTSRSMQTGHSGTHFDGDGIILDDWDNQLGGGTYADYSWGLVENNLSFSNGGCGIAVNRLRYALVRNNTSFNNNNDLGQVSAGVKGDICATQNAFMVVYQNVVATNPDVRCSNCNLSLVDGQFTANRTGTGNAFIQNCTFSGLAGQASTAFIASDRTVGNQLGVDPAFTDPANADFSMALGSTCGAWGANVNGSSGLQWSPLSPFIPWN